MKKTSYIIFVIILYLFFFDPPMFGFRGRMAFSILILLGSIILCLIKPSVFIVFKKENKTLFRLLFGLLLFVVIRSLLGGDISFIVQHILSVSSVFIVIPSFFYFANKNGFGDEKYIVRAVLIVSTIAAFFSIICLLNTPFNQFVRNQLIVYEETDYLYTNDFRGFGIASLLTSNFSFIQGFVAALGCFYLKQNKWFLFCIPIVIFSALINARTGVLISFVGFLIFFFSKNKTQYSVLFAVVLIIIYFSLIDILLNLGIDERTIDWAISLQDEVGGVLETGSVMGSSTAETLFGRMWIMPEDFSQWIIGRGYSLFRGGMGVGNSDVGWILQLNYGGLIYITLLYSAIIYMARRLFNIKDYSYMFFFILSFMIINTKTSIYPHDTIFYLMLMIYVLKKDRQSLQRR